MGDTDGYGSASTPDSVTEKAVHRLGSDSQNGVWRDRQHRHWEGGATRMYPLTTAICNIYAENITREAVEEWENGINAGRRMLTNLRFEDNTTLLAGTKEALIERVERVRRASEKAGLCLYVGETR